MRVILIALDSFLPIDEEPRTVSSSTRMGVPPVNGDSNNLWIGNSWEWLLHMFQVTLK